MRREKHPARRWRTRFADKILLLTEKLGLQEPAELVHFAIKHGYLEEP